MEKVPYVINDDTTRPSMYRIPAENTVHHRETETKVYNVFGPFRIIVATVCKQNQS